MGFFFFLTGRNWKIAVSSGHSTELLPRRLSLLLLSEFGALGWEGGYAPRGELCSGLGVSHQELGSFDAGVVWSRLLHARGRKGLR